MFGERPGIVPKASFREQKLRPSATLRIPTATREQPVCEQPKRNPVTFPTTISGKSKEGGWNHPNEK